jgi:hypothetical protein
MADVVDRSGYCASCQPTPHERQQDHAVRTLQQMLVEKMCHAQASSCQDGRFAPKGSFLAAAQHIVAHAILRNRFMATLSCAPLKAF